MKALSERERKYYKYGTTPYVTTVGSSTINDGIAIGFSTSNYLVLPSRYDLLIGSNTWEIDGKFTTGSDVSTSQYVYCLGSYGGNYQYGIGIGVTNTYLFLRIGQSSNKSLQLDTASGTISANTTYIFKCKFTGSSYELYLSDTETLPSSPTVTLSSSATLVVNSSYSLTNKIGVRQVYGESSSKNPWLGSIDLVSCYIKIADKEVWRGTFLENGTSSDYDFYKDVDVCSLPKEVVRKYYKYVEVVNTWVQPILTSNGTLGVDDVATYSNIYNGSNQVYKIFSNDSQTMSPLGSPISNVYWTLYNKNPICLTRFYGTFLNCKTLILYGSNDNENWTQIPFTYNGATQGSFDYPIENTQYYNYYKWFSSGQSYISSVSTCPYSTKMKIDATQKGIGVIESTSSDYDYYKDVDIYLAFKTYEKGQYYGN